MSKITNMHVVSDDKTLLHTSQIKPVAIGTVESIDGKEYRVIDNWSTTIVTYEPVEGSEPVSYEPFDNGAMLSCGLHGDKCPLIIKEQA